MCSTSGCLHNGCVILLFLQDHRETDHFFEGSGVQLVQSTSDQFHHRHSTFPLTVQSQVDNILTKDVEQRIDLNMDGVPTTSKSHTHSSHLQSSRELTSSLSLGVPVPRTTQCM